jgi:hypothetical protein
MEGNVKEALDAVQEYTDNRTKTEKLRMCRLLFNKCKEIKAEFKNVDSIEAPLEKLQTASFQLGALHVIEKMIDIINENLEQK